MEKASSDFFMQSVLILKAGPILSMDCTGLIKCRNG